MRLRMLIGRLGFGQLAGLVIDIEMALRRAVDAIGPVQPGVEPLRAVRRCHLTGQHEAHLVIIGAGVCLGGEIAALPTPIGPGPRKTVEHLLGRGFAHDPVSLGQLGKLRLVGHRPPQEFGHALFLHPLQPRRHARLAEILLRQNVRGDLAPAFGHFDRLVAEHDLAVRIADFGCGQGKAHGAISAGRFGRELALDLHLCPVSLCRGALARAPSA